MPINIWTGFFLDECGFMSFGWWHRLLCLQVISGESRGFPSLLSSYQFSRNSLILTYQGGNPAMHAGDIQLWHLEATSCKLIKEWDDQRPIRIMRENISTIIPEDPPWFGDS